jgi:hypothetical protein
VSSADGYSNLLIRIGGSAEGRYAVEADLEDGSHFREGVLELDEAELPTLLDRVAYGRKLAAALFRGPIERAWLKANTLAGARNGGRLRVRLCFDDTAAALHFHRWERLHSDGAFIAARPSTPVSRYFHRETAETPPVVGDELKMLIAISNPADLTGPMVVDVDQEIDNLLPALARARRSVIRLSIDVMSGRTPLAAATVARM